MFALGDEVDRALWDTQFPDNSFVQYTNAACGNRAHREFFVARNTELAHNKEVEWGIQFPRDFVGNKNSSPRKSKYQRIWLVFVGLEMSSKDLAGLYTVTEIHNGPPLGPF